MNEEDMIVSAELPGFDAASMDISVENNVLSISGDRETAAADVDGKPCAGSAMVADSIAPSTCPTASNWMRSTPISATAS